MWSARVCPASESHEKRWSLAAQKAEAENWKKKFFNHWRTQTKFAQTANYCCLSQLSTCISLDIAFRWLIDETLKSQIRRSLWITAIARDERWKKSVQQNYIHPSTLVQSNAATLLALSFNEKLLIHFALDWSSYLSLLFPRCLFHSGRREIKSFHQVREGENEKLKKLRFGPWLDGNWVGTQSVSIDLILDLTILPTTCQIPRSKIPRQPKSALPIRSRLESSNILHRACSFSTRILSLKKLTEGLSTKLCCTQLTRLLKKLSSSLQRANRSKHLLIPFNDLEEASDNAGRKRFGKRNFSY